MTMTYEDAVSALYRAPLQEFVAERKRLAADLKAGKDKDGADRLGKLARPPLSAWAVNQLWWHAREDFEALFASGARLRQGERAANAAHREAVAKLRARAATLLEESGHAATESTLRRVATTLTAVAAIGSFDPDLPGTLRADRDPPGFEALAGVLGPTEAEARKTGRERARSAKAEVERKRRLEREEKKAERLRVAAELRAAREEFARRSRDVNRLAVELERARRAAELAGEAVADLEKKLASIDGQR